MKISGVQSVYGKTSRTQKTENLPGVGETALSIDVTGNLVMSVTLYVAASFFWTLATTASEASTRLAANDTRCKWPSGVYSIPVSGESSNKLYLVAVGAAVTDGVSYTFVEAD